MKGTHVIYKPLELLCSITSTAPSPTCLPRIQTIVLLLMLFVLLHTITNARCFMFRLSINACANTVAATIKDEDHASQQPVNPQRKFFHASVINKRTC